jgi:NAD(P)-dependent dehydrogenase (short-subunit alcohol dehydrogenase family)
MATGNVVLVTGASSGIGRATANRLAAAGWRVWGGSRRAAAASEDASNPSSGDWTPVALDITRDDSVAAATTAVLSRDGRLDALVHCAGISVAGAVEDVTIEEAERQFATNYFGAVRTLQAVLPVMRGQGSGRIVLVGSIGGLIGLPFLGHYSASKFALDGLVEALRHEIAPFGIQATVLHPGDIRTEISANQIEGARTGESSAYASRFRGMVATYDKAVRDARGPEVIAGAIERVLQRRRQPPAVIAGTPIERTGVGLKAALPRSFFEVVIRKSYGL